jgi:hypothetical protein
MKPKVELDGESLRFTYHRGAANYIKELAITLSSSNDFADVTLHCSDRKEVKANSLVLVSSSKVFDDLFRSGCICSGDNFVIQLPGK